MKVYEIVNGWAEQNHVRFVSRTPGQYTTDTVSKASLEELVSTSAAPLLTEIEKLRDEKADLARMCKELEAKLAQQAEPKTLESGGIKTAQQADPMSRIAKSKLADLIADGYRECGVMIERPGDDGSVKRGAVSNGGMVIWWHPAQQAEAQEPFGFVWLEDGEWQLGTAFNGGPPLNAKAVFTRPQPAQLQRLGKDEWASVFRDASAAFFSDGCKNLTEQVNACAHAAMRATESALAAAGRMLIAQEGVKEK